MKRVKIRLGFFADKRDNEPTRSVELVLAIPKISGPPYFTTLFDEEMADWLFRYPQGKIVILG